MSRYPMLDAALADGRVEHGAGSTLDSTSYAKWKRDDHIFDAMRYAAMPQARSGCEVAMPKQPRWHRLLFGKGRLVAWGARKYDRDIASIEDKIDAMAKGEWGRRLAARAQGEAIHASIRGFAMIDLSQAHSFWGQPTVQDDLHAMGSMLDAIFRGDWHTPASWRRKPPPMSVYRWPGEH